MKYQDLCSLVNESVHDKNLLKAVITAGSPYSGKSTVSSQIAHTIHGVRTINIDKFVEFHGNKDVAKSNTVEQASLYINSMLPLIVDSTSTDTGRLYFRLAILKQLGYDVSFCLVHTTWEEIEERMKHRARRVDANIVKKYYDTIYNPHFLEEIGRMFPSNNIFQITNTNDQNNTVQQGVRAVSQYFNVPVQNTIGKNILQTLKRNRGQYLVDSGKFNLEEIQHIVSLWFKK